MSKISFKEDPFTWVGVKTFNLFDHAPYRESANALGKIIGLALALTLLCVVIYVVS